MVRIWACSMISTKCDFEAAVQVHAAFLIAFMRGLLASAACNTKSAAAVARMAIGGKLSVVAIGTTLLGMLWR
jgi:hypothetical protein